MFSLEIAWIAYFDLHPTRVEDTTFAYSHTEADFDSHGGGGHLLYSPSVKIILIFDDWILLSPSRLRSLREAKNQAVL